MRSCQAFSMWEEVHHLAEEGNSFAVAPMGVNRRVETSDGGNTIMSSERVIVSTIICDCEDVLGSQECV